MESEEPEGKEKEVISGGVKRKEDSIQELEQYLPSDLSKRQRLGDDTAVED